MDLVVCFAALNLALWTGKMATKSDKLKIRNPETPILFVDDDPIAHKIVSHYLKNWQLESVYSARDALDALEKKNFVIVITDLIMPEMNGIELLHEIKARYGNRVQVIVVTISDELDNLTKALDGGASDFLLKPLIKEDLEEVLEHTLAKIMRWKRVMNLLLEKKSKG
jgi:DNA-binding NtrC family response regulator